jgi:hypothetical protein
MATQAHIYWDPSLMMARRRALREGKVLLVYVSAAPQCQACVEFEEDALHDDEVVSFVDKYFVPVKLSYAREPHFIEKFEVKTAPTMLILDDQQAPQHRIEGKFSPHELLGQLSLGLGKLWLDSEWFEKSRKRLDEVIERHSGSEVAAEAEYWRNIGLKRQDDSRVEEAIAESFPASDPPSWNLGRDTAEPSADDHKS